MASTINASTSPAAIVQTADGTANLNLQSNGTTIAALTSTGMAVTGTLSASGAATLSSTLAVTGAATLSSTLAVTGAATLSSTLDVTGAITATGVIGSSTTGAIKMPSGTTAQRPSSATVGMLRFNTDTSYTEYYNGNAWMTPIERATQSAIIGFGENTPLGITNVSNIVNSLGIISGDVTGVGTARYGIAGANYGGDKAIIGYGMNGGVSSQLSLTNKVSNTGVVASDTTGVGTARTCPGMTGYGVGTAIVAYGYYTTTSVSISNLISNAGVVATDTTGVGSPRYDCPGARYGSTGQAIMAYGYRGLGYYTDYSLSNLISATGVVATDTTGVGTARQGTGCAGYGNDKAIYAYGYRDSPAGVVSMSNLVSNTGVVATDVTGVGTARMYPAAATYNGDKAFMAYGSSYTQITNLISNTGVIGTDTTVLGSSRSSTIAAGFSYT